MNPKKTVKNSQKTLKNPHKNAQENQKVISFCNIHSYEKRRDTPLGQLLHTISFLNEIEKVACCMRVEFLRKRV
jgi:hypothetical protein